jgi:hypothetical protein
VGPIETKNPSASAIVIRKDTFSKGIFFVRSYRNVFRLHCLQVEIVALLMRHVCFIGFSMAFSFAFRLSTSLVFDIHLPFTRNVAATLRFVIEVAHHVFGRLFRQFVKCWQQADVSTFAIAR